MGEVNQKLQGKIPAYMMPGRIIYMESLPHNANGKVDRRKLESVCL